MAKKSKVRGSTPADAAMGQRIRLMRTEAGLSQAELGDALGVTFQQVQKYEKGVNRVAANRLTQIAATLNVPVLSLYAEQTKDKGHNEMQSLLFTDSKFSLRLLRAYVAIKDLEFKRHFVTLLEQAAAIEGKK